MYSFALYHDNQVHVKWPTTLKTSLMPIVNLPMPSNAIIIHRTSLVTKPLGRRLPFGLKPLMPHSGRTDMVLVRRVIVFIHGWPSHLLLTWWRMHILGMLRWIMLIMLCSQQAEHKVVDCEAAYDD